MYQHLLYNKLTPSKKKQKNIMAGAGIYLASNSVGYQLELVSAGLTHASWSVGRLPRTASPETTGLSTSSSIL